MSELGSAYLSIVPKADKAAMSSAIGGIKSSLSEAGEASGKSAGDGFGSWFKTTAGVFVGNIATELANAGAEAAKQLFSAAYDGYAEYEQLIGGMDTLYGDSSQRMQEYAEAAFSTAQMSANDYMDLATSFAASLTTSLDGDTAAAAEYANLAITDMADNANKMGTSMEDIENAYKGFSKQNYTMLDNLKLGYGGTKSEMERLLSDAQAIKAANGETVEYSIDSFADMVEAIHVVQENTGIAGTTAEEAATTIQGSTAMMQASWANFLTFLGTGDYDKIKGALADALSSTEAMVSNAVPAIGTIVTSAVSVIGDELYAQCPEEVQRAIDAATEKASAFLDAAAPFAESIMETVAETASKVIDALGPVAEDLLGFIDELSGELAPVVEGIAEFIDAALEDASTQLGVALDAMRALWDAFWPVLKDTVLAAFEAIAPIVQSALDLVSSIISTVTAAMSGDWSGVWSGMQSVAQNAWNLICSIVSGAVGIISGVVSAAASALSSAISAGLDGIVGLFANLPGNIVSALGSLGSLLWNAGSSIVSGLLQGIQDSIGSVYGFVSGIADTIASLKGPIPYDLKLLIPNGEAIMSGLAAGLESGFGPVEELVGGMAGDLADSFGTPSLAVEAVSSGGSARDGASGLMAAMSRLGDSLAGLASSQGGEVAIYVDGKKLASTIAKPMNQQLAVLGRRGA